MKVRRSLTILALLFALTGLASASTIFGNFAFTTFSGIGYTVAVPGQTLNMATHIQLSGNEIAGFIPPNYILGIPNDFYSGPNSFASLSSISFFNLNWDLAALGGIPNFMTFAGGAGGTTPPNRYHFDSVSASVGRVNGANEISIFVLGTFRDDTDPTLTQTAKILLNLTQVGGPGTGVSMSGTFNTPAAIPEPASLALMGGGLLGIALLLRRRNRN